jgi:hypothetical protein
MDKIHQLLEGAGDRYVQNQKAKELVSKWEHTGLLEGLNGEQQVSSMAQVLENQAKQLLDEATRTGTTANSEQWAGVALPLVRRVFGEIAAQEFVSVQPMNLPSGLVFYLDYKYGTNQNAKPAFSGSSLYGGTGNDALEAPTDAAVNGLYGSGRFGYSINDVLTGAVTPTSASATTVDTNFDTTLSASLAAGELHKLTVASSTLTGADLEGVRAFQVSGSAVVANLGAFNRVEGSNVLLFVSGAADADFSDSKIAYQKQPTDSTRGDFEDGAVAAFGQDIDIPEVNLDVRSKPIVAKTRKLKAQWTPELAQDLNAYHAIDAEAELTSVLSDYISMEVDLEILDMLIQNAVTTEFWSARVGFEFDSNSQSFVLGSDSASALAYQKNTWFQTLGTKINKVSNKIHQLTLRGGANFIVTSPDISTILESIPAFTTNAGKDATEYAAGVTQVGSLSNRYTVYKNPYMTENTILVGYKGDNFLESGAVYAPYIPLIMTPTVYDPTNFTPRRGIMTRYAKEMTRGEFYGTIRVEGLESL